MSPARVARVYLALAALAALAGVVGAVGMQLELWSPGALGDAESYGRFLTAHGVFLPAALAAPALAGALGYVAVTDIAGAQRLPVPLLAGAGLLAWIVGLAASVAAVASGGGAPILAVVALAAFATSGLLSAVHLGLVLWPRLRAVPGVTALLAAAFVLGVGFASAAALDGAVRGVSHDVAPATAVAVAALATLAVLRDPEQPLWRRPAAAVIALGAIPAAGFFIYVRGVLAGLGTDVYLHDTYFVVGSYHLLAAATAFAALAALVAWAEPLVGREPRPWLVRVGVVLASAGMLAHVRAALRLGTDGMPRRYWSYSPEFTSGHRSAGVGAAIALAGAAILVLAVVLAKKPRRV